MHRPLIETLARGTCTAALLALVAVGTSCAPPEEEDVGITEKSSAVWLSFGSGAQAWPNGSIRVCLQPSPNTPSSDLEAVRTSIRQTLGNGWGRAANLQFWDFGNCPGGTLTNMVKVTFDTTSSNNSNQRGMWTNNLNVVNFQWDHDLSQAPSSDLILHEFGHVLGFAHEESRSGYVAVNSTCPAEATVSGDPKGTPLDPASIMMQTGDCTLPFTGLSGWDIVGVQNIYGRKKQGVIDGMNNECVNIPNGTNPPSGQNLQVFDCSSATNEIWSFKTNTNQLIAKNVSNGNSVVDIEGASTANDTPIQVFGSNLGPNQQWFFRGMQILGVGNRCLDIPPGTSSVQIFDCNGGANQLWDVVAQPTAGTIKIRNSGTLNCLTVPSGATSGTDLTLTTCSTAANASQTFAFTASGELKWGSLCLDTEFGDPVDGRALQVFTCKGSGIGKSNQQYFFRGPIQSGLATCMSTPGTDFRKGDALISYACETSAPTPDFVWDVYLTP
jgi:hypothetical protein